MDNSMIPDNTVTLVINYKGRIFTKGYKLSEDLSDDENLARGVSDLHALYTAMRFALCHRAAARDHKQTREIIKKARIQNGK